MIKLCPWENNFLVGFFFSIFSFIWANEGTWWHGQMKMRKEALKTYEQKYYAFWVGRGERVGKGGLILSTLIGASCSIHKAKGHQTTNPNHLNSDISESFLLVFVFPSLSLLSLFLSLSLSLLLFPRERNTILVDTCVNRID
jgi:hypothetical protein